MSGSKIRLYGSTSGYVELAPPAVSPDAVLTLPPTFAGIGTNVVSTTKTDTFSSTSTGLFDITGLSATITPTSASSKVLIHVAVAFSENTAESNTHGITVTDGSDNNLVVPDSPGSRTPGVTQQFVPVTNANLNHVSFTLLHAPATTSAFTYKVKAFSTGGTTYVNRQGTDSDNANNMRSVSTITLIEVAA